MYVKAAIFECSIMVIIVFESVHNLNIYSSGQIRIPSHISILHVEQEVVGDDTLATQSVLECDTKREALLKEEKDISAKLNSTR